MSCIIKKGNQMIAVVLTVCCMLITLTQHIYAANHIAISIPVSQTLTIHGQSQNQYQSTYQFEALDNDCPMPSNSQNNNYYFTMSNNDQTHIDLQFTHAGIFSYQLSQVVNDENNQMTYDDTKYQLDIYVKNTNDGGLIASVIAYLENGNKTGVIQFQNELNLQTTSEDNVSDENTETQPTTPSVQVTPDRTGEETTLVGQNNRTGTITRGQTTATTSRDNQENNDLDNQQDVPVNSQIGENQLPLAGTIDHWALVNLICAILAVILAIINLLWKHQKENDDDNTIITRRRWLKVGEVIIAIVSLIVFILTENMSLPMTLVDQWTFIMVILAVLNIVILIINGLWKKTVDNNE